MQRTTTPGQALPLALTGGDIEPSFMGLGIPAGLSWQRPLLPGNLEIIGKAEAIGTWRGQ
jgi:hypothetical protein